MFRGIRENAASTGYDEKGIIQARKSFWKSKIWSENFKNSVPVLEDTVTEISLKANKEKNNRSEKEN